MLGGRRLLCYAILNKSNSSGSITLPKAMSVHPIRSSISNATRELSREILARDEMVEVLNRLPYMALVVNGNREVVFANRMFLDTIGLPGMVEALALRPGELLHCVHSHAQAGGCGGAEGCRHCQAARTIEEALRTQARVVGEARISARVAGRLIAYDLQVTAQPLELAGEELAMVFLEDIGARKRREHLESIFLHDLLNRVSNLQLLAEQLLEEPGRVAPAELARQVQLMVDEVRAQQILGEAERGELQRNVQCVPARLLIDETLAGIGAWSAKRGVVLALDLPEEPVYLATDALVARRVLLNAVKNAVEAANPGETVKVGVASGGATVALTVWNPQHMPASTQHQVFQRSFSTKGGGRGLGTYSMRLLMENYLGGTVSFSSDPTAGTTFTLTFPSMQGYLAGGR